MNDTVDRLRAFHQRHRIPSAQEFLTRQTIDIAASGLAFRLQYQRSLTSTSSNFWCATRAAFQTNPQLEACADGVEYRRYDDNGDIRPLYELEIKDGTVVWVHISCENVPARKRKSINLTRAIGRSTALVRLMAYSLLLLPGHRRADVPIKWCARRDSNSLPTGSKPVALSR